MSSRRSTRSACATEARKSEGRYFRKYGNPIDTVRRFDCPFDVIAYRPGVEQRGKRDRCDIMAGRGKRVGCDCLAPETSCDPVSFPATFATVVTQKKSATQLPV